VRIVLSELLCDWTVYSKCFLMEPNIPTEDKDTESTPAKNTQPSTLMRSPDSTTPTRVAVHPPMSSPDTAPPSKHSVLIAVGVVASIILVLLLIIWRLGCCAAASKTGENYTCYPHNTSLINALRSATRDVIGRTCVT